MVSKPKAEQTVSQDKLIAELGEQLEFDRPLAEFTTFGTGGPARLFLEAKSIEAMTQAVAAANRLKLDYLVIGGGSNLLVADSGYDGLVIRAGIGGLKLLKETEIVCGAGEDLMSLVDFAAGHSLSGLEFAAGIWGSVGGAVFGNAGAYGGDISQVLAEATLVDTKGQVKTVGSEYLRFGYRDSRLKSTQEIVVEARFRLQKSDEKQIRDKVNSILKEREAKFPPTDRCAGCIFKNIPDADSEHGKIPAGRLLEEVGAKSMSVGDARVSERHANIIVNSGKATSKDIRRLADKLKEKVFEKYGIMLQEEVIQVGQF
ncbi:MAG: UDP-N-acetylmuramate dehydrogenase [candidate division Zixibacteria bacterium]|nr:UDP-N-acetylmuramate dehydrogenase [candidate division Zixibacteria bacterium]MDH3938452.1 UDP-N-acetylmuramate dehydrogenase [candidate division Zixibacteria bacterium]MDH4035150.1 UDP-N-acetylmuramate dehydrogenase [candidate division Zixibacteria bacterium]